MKQRKAQSLKVCDTITIATPEKALYKTELFAELFTEPEEMRLKRHSCEDHIKAVIPWCLFFNNIRSIVFYLFFMFIFQTYSNFIQSLDLTRDLQGQIGWSQEGTGALGTNLWCRCQLWTLKLLNCEASFHSTIDLLVQRRAVQLRRALSTPFWVGKGETVKHATIDDSRDCKLRGKGHTPKASSEGEGSFN